MKLKISKPKRSKKRMARHFFAPMPAVLPPHIAELYRRHEELKFRLASDCTAHILFNGNTTQGAIRKLIGYLEMSVVDFPIEGDTPVPPQA